MVGQHHVSWIAAGAASCLVHVGLVAAAVLVGPSLVRPPEPPVLQADLVAPDPPAPAPPIPPPLARRLPPPRPAAPLTPPRLVETPVPAVEPRRMPEPPRVEPEPTPEPTRDQPRAPEPAPTPPTERTRDEPAPQRPPASAATPTPSSVPAVAPAPTGAAGDPAPGAVTWPAPPAAGVLADAVPATGRGSTARGGGGALARGTGDVTATAYPRGGYQVQPSYPSSARRLGIQGTSLLRVLVEADGRVGDVVVQTSAGHPDLDQAAAQAVRRWRFEPARRGSEAVAMWVLLPVEFHLK